MEENPLCDFDECAAEATDRRGPMTYCAQHAAEHDALGRGKKHALQLVLEHYLDADCEISSYSGRAMYGKRCLAIAGPLPKIIGSIVAGCLSEGEELSPIDQADIREAVAALRLDQLGRGEIMYFPDVTYVGVDDE